jgi:hypothetical protein
MRTNRARYASCYSILRPSLLTNAFLALDVGGVLLRRTGHGPTAIGDQAHFHVVGVEPQSK